MSFVKYVVNVPFQQKCQDLKDYYELWKECRALEKFCKKTYEHCLCVTFMEKKSPLGSTVKYCDGFFRKHCDICPASCVHNEYWKKMDELKKCVDYKDAFWATKFSNAR